MEQNCNSCGKQTEKQSVPYIVYEAEAARHERHTKRLVIAIIIAIIAIFINNAIWLWAWMQYDYAGEETVYTQDGQGTNIIGSSNEVVNNGSEAND